MSSTSPTVSIALATHNGAAYLGDQVESFLTQNRLPDELVVSDDCSEDETMVELERFAERAPFPVRIHRNEQRLGPSANFSRAIGLCSGELIMLSDQDDLWLPRKIERLMEVFQNQPSIVVAIHDLSIVDSTLRPVGTTQLERMSQLRIPTATHVTGSSTALRAEILPMVLPLPDYIRTYDAWIHAVGQAVGGRSVITEVLSLYRRHADTDTNAVSASWSFRRLASAVRQSLRSPSDVTSGERHAWLDELERRFASLSENEWRALPEGARDNVEQYLTRQRWAVEERRSVIESPWPLRPTRTLSAYRRGVYSEFAGPGSAVRDLLFKTRAWGTK